MNNPDFDLEKRLWAAAYRLRSKMHAAEYKHLSRYAEFEKLVNRSSVKR